MRLLAQLFGTTGVCSLAALAPVFLVSVSLPSASAVVLVPRTLNPSLIPAACTSTCQAAVSAQSTCGTDLKCLCTNDNGNNFTQCMDCVVSAASASDSTLAQSAGEGVLSDFARKCAQNETPISSLTLSLSSASAAPTGTVAKTNDAHPMTAPHSFMLGLAALVLAARLGVVL
ncbi:hypothetical protein DFH09DRAFT_1150320 [Mycena vulgaris]|nr:hypothetical protein DFH09DRAFT_1150320 [Mycena vulgaris]